MSRLEAKFKCRLCGETFYDGACSRDTAQAAIVALTTTEHFYPEGSGIGIHRYAVHKCNDLEYGFADFVGFEHGAYWWMEPHEDCQYSTIGDRR